MIARPTSAQVEVVRYFNDGTLPSRPYGQGTYAVCERHGWIERCDQWPYHRTTDAGREILTASQR